MKNKKKGGFTLIELLIVVAIIGLLATIVLLAVTKARRKANAVTAKGHATQIAQAFDMYIANGCAGNVNVPTSGGITDCNGELLMRAIPSPPVASITYTIAGQYYNYTITVSGLRNNSNQARTFVCQNGSCSCSTPGECVMSL